MGPGAMSDSRFATIEIVYGSVYSMAFLVEKKRINPETGKKEPYYLMGRWVQVGPTRHQETHSLGFVSKKEAERLKTVWEGQLAGGVDPLKKTEPVLEENTPLKKTEAPDTKKGPPRLRDWWGEVTQDGWAPCRILAWLKAVGAKPSTINGYLYSRKTILELLGERLLTEITPAIGDEFVATLRSRGLSARTIQIRVDHLRKSLELAQEDGLISVVPRLRRPKSKRTPSVFHTPEQTSLLLQTLRQRVAGQRAGGRSYLAILMAVSLGMRPGEVLTRRWEHLNFEASTVTICAVTLPDRSVWEPKKASGRVVPLTGDLVQLLRESWLAVGRPATGWIFPNRDREGWPSKTFKKSLANACEAAGLPVLHPHALRHTAATRWTHNQVDVPTMMKLGGWSTPTVPLQVYAHSTEQWAAEAIQRTAPIVDQTLLTSPSVGQQGLKK